MQLKLMGICRRCAFYDGAALMVSPPDPGVFTEHRKGKQIINKKAKVYSPLDCTHILTIASVYIIAYIDCICRRKNSYI